MLGTWATGGVAVPIHVAHPPPEIEHVLKDSMPRVVVYHEQFAEVMEPIAASLNVPCLQVGTDGLFLNSTKHVTSSRSQPL
jgi:acyl-CoA synthetase (AMP-forming)/AMP-acid ligase II